MDSDRISRATLDMSSDTVSFKCDLTRTHSNLYCGTYAQNIQENIHLSPGTDQKERITTSCCNNINNAARSVLASYALEVNQWAATFQQRYIDPVQNVIKILEDAELCAKEGKCHN